MIDRQGKPLTDPKRADEGFLLPIGEHKGYGLALMVGLLAGTILAVGGGGGGKGGNLNCMPLTIGAAAVGPYYGALIRRGQLQGESPASDKKWPRRKRANNKLLSMQR